MKYVFGPVNSRRLGISLGVDIIPFKVCSLNCVYCECGGTTELTDEVKEYIPYGEIIAELSKVLNEKPRIDVITFSGSGEPTLNSRLGDIINFLKENYPEYKVAVLTNSTLLYKAEVRNAILKADIIYPSLDAVSDDIFNRMLRPFPGINSESIIESISLLRNEFKGILCLEIFIIPGLNSSEDELLKLKDACIRIRPDEIHLNHLDRPGAEEWVKTADSESMERVREFFKPLPVKLVGRENGSEKVKDYFEPYEKSVFEALEKNGSSAEELANRLDMRLFDVLRALKNLQKKKNVYKTISGNKEIFSSNPTGKNCSD